MNLSANDQRALRQAQDDLRRKVAIACQSADLDELIIKLSEVWASNTRAIQLAMRVRDDTRERAQQEIAA